MYYLGIDFLCPIYCACMTIKCKCVCYLLFLLTILRSETLNPEQRKVFDLAVNGHNVYIGGSGGTGKLL